MIDNDDDFLIWLSNRLLFKYKEDSRVVERIISIVEKNKLTISNIKENNTTLDSAIVRVINYLNSIRNKNRSYDETISSKSKILDIEKNKSNFENLDIERLLND